MPLPQTDDELLLLHNPRCSKSRAALALLEERGAPFAVRRYLDAPLDRGELDDLRRRLGRPVREWARTDEPAWREAAPAEDAPEEALLELLVRQPALLQRPILVRGRRAVLGRPPEAVLALL